MDAQQLQYLGEQIALATKLGMLLSAACGLFTAGTIRFASNALYQWRAHRRFRAFQRRKAARMVQP